MHTHSALEYPLQAVDTRDYLLQSGLLVAVLSIIYDVMFADNVPVYISTGKWRVLKVTPRWQHRGWSLRSVTALFCHWNELTLGLEAADTGHRYPEVFSQSWTVSGWTKIMAAFHFGLHFSLSTQIVRWKHMQKKFNFCPLTDTWLSRNAGCEQMKVKVVQVPALVHCMAR